jgi:hypothetical protein
MNPKPFAALNHLTVPFSMEHVLSCYFYNPTQPSGKVYAEHTDLRLPPHCQVLPWELHLINGVSTLEGVRAVRQRFRFPKPRLIDGIL